MLGSLCHRRVGSQGLELRRVALGLALRRCCPETLHGFWTEACIFALHHCNLLPAAPHPPTDHEKPEARPRGTFQGRRSVHTAPLMRSLSEPARP